MRLSIFFLLAFFNVYSQTTCVEAGADFSYTNSVLAHGGVYRNTTGQVVDPYAYFAQRGCTLARFRLFHTPQNRMDVCGNPITAGSLADVTLGLQRAKAAGMKLLVSLHYGDYFNDPGRQKRPAAWMGLSQTVLLDSIRNYTLKVLNHFKTNNVIPETVVVGNETTWGFIDETDATNGWQFPADGQKFNAALYAIDDFNSTNQVHVKKMVHFTDSTAIWMLSQFQTVGMVANYDAIGISFYPSISPLANWADFDSMIQQLQSNVTADIYILETGAPWTTAYADNYNNGSSSMGNFSYPISPQGQKQYLLDLIQHSQNKGVKAVVYWEPTWISSSLCDAWGQGSSYENASFFNFQQNNQALPAFDWFTYCTSLAQSDFEPVEGIRIFPNPTANIVHVKGLKEANKMKLYSLLGQEISSVILGETIDVSGLPEGCYFLSIEQDGKWQTFRVFKK
ncbi:MAG: hypothetical protein CFE24_13990 [Flavobacterium sp. BFFFF2]|nr:MAG: hypothetical protein CFE24_13990 [Flavobacterium sp. BFFFF2]